jgi:hypothetical protein
VRIKTKPGIFCRSSGKISKSVEKEWVRSQQIDETLVGLNIGMSWREHIMKTDGMLKTTTENKSLSQYMARRVGRSVQREANTQEKILVGKDL